MTDKYDKKIVAPVNEEELPLAEFVSIKGKGKGFIDYGDWRNPVFIPFSKVANDNPEEAKFFELEPWRPVEDFTKTSDGRNTEYILEEDIRDLIRDVAVRIESVLRKHVYLPYDWQYAIVTNMIIITYLLPLLEYFPRLIIQGATESGKSKLMKIVTSLCYHGISYTGTTVPVLFRVANKCHCSLIIDECQSYNQAALNDIFRFVKAGFERPGLYARVNENFQIEHFRTDVPLVIGTNRNIAPIDVVNRSIVINMLQCPPGIKLVRKLDLKELDSIRKDLLHIKYAVYYQEGYYSQPEHRDEEHFDLRAAIEGYVDVLDSYVESGADTPPTDSMIPAGGWLHGRNVDVASIYYPMSRLTGTSSEVFEGLRVQWSKISEEYKASIESTVVAGIIACTKIKMEKDHLPFDEAIRKISTRDITDCVNELECRSGNAPDKPICTRTVSNTLKVLNFTTKSGSRNKSYLANDEFSLYDTLETNIRRFGTDADMEFFVNNAVNPAANKTVNPSPTNKPDCSEESDEVKKVTGDEAQGPGGDC